MEWTVIATFITTLIALVGFIITIVKTVLPLNTAITKLTLLVDTLIRDVEKLDGKNSASHARLWEHNKTQDDRLDDHETRLTVIERKDG